MADSGSDWDSLPPQGEGPAKNGTAMEEHFDFRGEVTPIKHDQRGSQKQHPPGREQPRQPRAYEVVAEAEAKGVKGKTVKGGEQLHQDQQPQPQPRKQSHSTASVLSSQRSSSQATAVLQDRRFKQPFSNENSFDGLDNPGFDDAFSIREKPSNGEDVEEDDGLEVVASKRSKSRPPKSDERIQLWHFEDPADSFFQISEENNGLWADKIGSRIVVKCDRLCAEAAGILKIPFVLVVLGFSHVLMFALKAVVRPLADYFWKPFLVALHNSVLVPACGLTHHCCVLWAHAISPCVRMCSLFCSGCCSSRLRGRYYDAVEEEEEVSPI